MKRYLILFGYLLLITRVSQANNVLVSNVLLGEQDEASGTVFLEFDITWQHSWRTTAGPGNWDAAWVFAKYRPATGGAWKHVRLSGAATHPTASVNVQDERGAMVFRKFQGSGTIRFDDVRLVWNYGADAVDGDQDIELQVFAIEMVYVPRAAFSVGDYNTGATFYRGDTETNPQPYSITSENAITVAKTAGAVYYDNWGDQNGPIPGSYPKGYDAFYCMKYEVSQQQWVDFFNTLTPTQQSFHDITGGNGKDSDGVVNRNGVSWSGSGPATTTLPFVAANFIGLEQALAYLDWAALRPMTELEFEKACRGTVTPVRNELAWGTAGTTTKTYTLADAGQADERIANPGVGESNFLTSSKRGSIDGPVRTGIFAASAVNTNRLETGGSFYGIMELSGNLWERVVTVGTAVGRRFSNHHGNGDLAPTGRADVREWATIDLGAYTIRGGSWSDFAVSDSYVSSRGLTYSNWAGGNSNIGTFRGVRGF